MNFKEEARPLCMTLCIVGLIAAGVSEAFGYPFPKWFICFCSVYAGEWLIERGVRKSIGKE